MKKNNLIFLLLTVLIIAVGVTGIGGVKLLLPYFKEQVSTYPKEPSQNPLLYVDNNNALKLYPWNVYDEKDSVSIERYLEQNTEALEKERALDVSAPSWNRMLSSKQEINGYINVFVNTMEGKEVLSGSTDFTVHIRYNESTQIFFLKDLPCKTTHGDDYILTMAFTKRNISYYHFIPKTVPAPTEQQLKEHSAALSKMTEQLQEQLEIEQFKQDDTISSAQQASSPNLLLDLLQKLRKTPYFYTSDILSAMRSRKMSNFYYQNEILLLFPMESGGSSAPGGFAATQPIVIHYDPVHGRISGFSIMA